MTDLDRFMAGEMDWREFVAEDDAERAAHGLPPVPPLSAEDEWRWWLRKALKWEAAQNAPQLTHTDALAQR